MQAPRILGMDELMLADEMRGIIVDIETRWPIELLHLMASFGSTRPCMASISSAAARNRAVSAW